MRIKYIDILLEFRRYTQLEIIQLFQIVDGDGPSLISGS